MTTEPTNREIAAVARKAAEIIQQRGKATGVQEDTDGRVCAHGALRAARIELGWALASHLLVGQIARRCRAISAVQPLHLAAWNDLPTTTEADIAAVFLQVADDLEVAP